MRTVAAVSSVALLASGLSSSGMAESTSTRCTHAGGAVGAAEADAPTFTTTLARLLATMTAATTQRFMLWCSTDRPSSPSSVPSGAHQCGICPVGAHDLDRQQ